VTRFISEERDARCDISTPLISCGAMWRATEVTSPCGSCGRGAAVILMKSMSTLAEIEAAAETLPDKEKQELLLFLAARLRAGAGPLPPPRKFTREEMAAWIAEDEEDMRRLREPT